MDEPVKNNSGLMPFGRSDTSRIENLSDAVFAFAITLLVVSLQVPTSFGQLENSMKGFPAFGVTLALLIAIWHTHYNFFKHYHIIDGPIIFLNSLLLLVVLFYIYPLKFLASVLINSGLMNTVLGIHRDENKIKL